jgi:hypothetical protein
MTDEDLEQLIGRYRPSAPTPELRARILDLPNRPRVRLGTVDWVCAAAAAVLIVASVVTRVQQPVSVRVTAAQTDRRRAVQDTAAMLGGDAAAVALAEVAVPPFPTTAKQSVKQPW